MKSPGPLAPPWTRPSLKITPRSYSLTILMALNMTEPTNIAIITNTMAEKPIPTICNKPKIAYIRDPPFILACRVEILTMAGQLDGHHLHYPSVAETHHRHLLSYPYHRLAISRVGFLGGERQHGPPPLAVHEYPSLGSHPDRIPSLPVMAGLPLRERKEPRMPKSTPPMSIATTTIAPSSTPE